MIRFGLVPYSVRGRKVARTRVLYSLVCARRTGAADREGDEQGTAERYDSGFKPPSVSRGREQPGIFAFGWTDPGYQVVSGVRYSDTGHALPTQSPVLSLALSRRCYGLAAVTVVSSIKTPSPHAARVRVNTRGGRERG